MVVDFTGCLQFRNPLELSAAYFLFNQFTTFSSVFFAVRVYSDYELSTLSTEFLWKCSRSLLAAWLVFYALLMSKLKKEYRYTFYSTVTGKQMTVEQFAKVEDAEVKFNIFTRHPALWTSIAEDVQERTHANWEVWTEEQPEWFTDVAIARVPDSFIPDIARMALDEAARGGLRMKSSVGIFGRTVELDN